MMLATFQARLNAPLLLAALLLFLALALAQDAAVVINQPAAPPSGPTPLSLLPPCPGRYCGRLRESAELSGAEAPCGACPRAHRSNGRVCVPCTADLNAYGATFLLFSALLVVVPSVVYALKATALSTLSSSQRLGLALMPVAEGALAAIAALALTSDPRGSFRLHSCGLERLSDWYPVFFNPRPEYTYQIHCVNEVVFPLMTWPLIFDAFCLVFVVVARIPLHHRFQRKDFAPVYFTLCVLPVHAFGHVVLGGFLYYCFPYAVMLGAVVYKTGEMASKDNGFDDSPLMAGLQFCVSQFGSGRRLIHFLLVHMTLAFGMVAISVSFGGTSPNLVALYVLGPLALPIIYLGSRLFTSVDYQSQ